jgi:UDP-N-acetylmuramoyl-L-alanyl-D-glutamate--2,6-diaminopimelate ligase
MKKKKMLFHNSKEVKPGGTYFALRDNTYVDEAIANGAATIVSTVKGSQENVSWVIVPDAREAMALYSKKFYNNACDKMRITAVVGTNGKTTTAHMVQHILEVATGKNVGLIGTTTGVLTTPDPIDLHRRFSGMLENGIKDVVMEVSAHAIHYKKVSGINFDAVIFTNITQDHLDFFGDFESYKNTKVNFFRNASIGTAVINADDKYSAEVLAALQGNDGTRVMTFTKPELEIPILGWFNVYNAMGAALTCKSYGIEWEVVLEALKTLPQVPGRFNTCDINGVTVVIDYAHTPDGLEKILSAARKLTAGRLFSVFGCGGDRDRGKRTKMGEISYRLADFTILTSDNPRTENPNEIIAEIERGIEIISVEIERIKYLKIPDRTDAIKYAVSVAKPGDVVVIAGKGHEDYMDVNGVKIPYNDSKVLDNIRSGSEE